jgi:hypothetical protein
VVVVVVAAQAVAVAAVATEGEDMVVEVSIRNAFQKSWVQQIPLRLSPTRWLRRQGLVKPFVHSCSKFL